MCKTRWSERDLAYEHFYLVLPFIVEATKVINGTHAEMTSFEKKYTKRIKREATTLLNAVTCFEFIGFAWNGKTFAIAIIFLFLFFSTANLDGLTKVAG